MKVHCCVAAYISDYAFLGTALLPHRQYSIKFMVSLDHSMWFHAPFRADHWMLYECESPWAGESSPRSPGTRVAKTSPARPGGAAGRGLTGPLCRRVPGTGAGTAVAQRRGPGCHLRAGRSHQGGANAKPEQALAEESPRAEARARRGRDPGTETDTGKAGPGRQREAASQETGLDPALWAVLVPEVLCDG